MTNKLTVMRDPTNKRAFIAEYNGEEAHNLAPTGRITDAIIEALMVFGISEDDIDIEATN